MKIALIDDHMVLVEALQSSLSSAIAESEVRVFIKGKTFLSNNFEEWSPDIVVSDVVMPDMDGIEVFRNSAPLLKSTCKFIFLSAVTESTVIRDIIREGAAGFVCKGSSLEELVHAIETVQKDKQYVSQALKDELLKLMLSNEQHVNFQLSAREKEVLVKLCEGRTSKEIAYDLHLSYNTIQIYNAAILRKLKVNRTLDAVTFSLGSGLYKRLKEEQKAMLV